MKIYVKAMLALQAFSVVWFSFIEGTSGDPGTALGWVFFQFLITPFVALALILVVVRWLMQLAIPRV
jgi:hypothetical protein